MRGRRRGGKNRGGRTTNRGASSSAASSNSKSTPRSKKIVEISKNQKTLMDYYFDKPKEIIPLPPKIKEEEDIVEEPEQNPFSEMETKLISLVKAHQLNEILTYFQMADRFLLQFSTNDMKYFYRIVQKEMIDEFGAPISPSLFPSILFDHSIDQQEDSSSVSQTAKSLF